MQFRYRLSIVSRRQEDIQLDLSCLFDNSREFIAINMSNDIQAIFRKLVSAHVPE